MHKPKDGRSATVPSPLPDFDTLKAMAEYQPEQLEALRTNLIKALIASVPEHRRRRLEGMEFHIDMTRRRAKTPLQCCLKLSQLMWEKVDELNSALHGLPYEASNPFGNPERQQQQRDQAAKAQPAANVVNLFPDQARGQ